MISSQPVSILSTARLQSVSIFPRRVMAGDYRNFLAAEILSESKIVYRLLLVSKIPTNRTVRSHIACSAGSSKSTAMLLRGNISDPYPTSVRLNCLGCSSISTIPRTHVNRAQFMRHTFSLAAQAQNLYMRKRRSKMERMRTCRVALS